MRFPPTRREEPRIEGVVTSIRVAAAALLVCYAAPKPMKLPIPFLLYATALGLACHAGWMVYEIVPLRDRAVRDKATADGQKEGSAAVERGRSRGAKTSNWVYSREAEPWWANLKTTNWTGKPPPPPPKDPAQIAAETKPVVVADERPLEQLIELVSLVYDGQYGGKGGNSHVIVRFKPEANVQPPEWWVRENIAAPTAGAPGAMRPAGGLDTVPNRGGGRGGRGGAAAPQGRPANQPQPAPTTAMPASGGLTGREVLQKIWVEDGGDLRRVAQLWPIKSSDGRELGAIRLVRVAPDAQSAFFSRVPPARDGQPAAAPKEEELIKTIADLSQDILRELRVLQGRDKAVAGGGAGGDKPKMTLVDDGPPKWTDVEETTREGNRFNIGRKDEQRWRDDQDKVMEQVTADTYVSRSGVRGLIVKAVDEQLSNNFGVVAGDVLLEVNGRKVESKAQTVAFVKDDYKRGVRTFVSKWMSNGQVVERSYTVRDR